MRGRTRGVVAVATMVVLTAGSGGVAFAGDLTPKDIYERAAPSTVHVIGTYGSGTGVIYDADKGLIVTNAHVVQGEPSLRVAVEDRAPVAARMLGIDPCEDLAVLTFSHPQPNLKEAKFGDSKEVSFADNVTALGYPDSIEAQGAQKPVFTTGAVQNPDVRDSAPDATMPRYPSTIQHSATINPGNSGGPLLNGKAEVIGINTLSLQGGGMQGQFYAISSDHVRPLLDQLAAGDVKNDLGWKLVDLKNPNLADFFVEEAAPKVAQTQKALKDVDGMMVVYALTNSPAAKAKLGSGDVITDMKDTPVASLAEVCDVLQSAAPGETVPVEGVYSPINADGKEMKSGETWTTDLVVGKAK
ncbi:MULTISPECIES: S1C family serine protease [Streptomyces]|uniref:Trypsin-like peptidase domain-containing protein n=1 Tax=Streptomyces katrae TaxID=68223 RepID=A0ABT7GN60_9ACTN|nr:MULTISPECIES: trypsin-like peptidase domain-containing protein [Streptomyces]MDK9495012.1 trypsin-like peptidase domain-containing protein [Streptomyces katrae]